MDRSPPVKPITTILHSVINHRFICCLSCTFDPVTDPIRAFGIDNSKFLITRVSRSCMNCFDTVDTLLYLFSACCDSIFIQRSSSSTQESSPADRCNVSTCVDNHVGMEHGIVIVFGLWFVDVRGALATGSVISISHCRFGRRA